MDLKSEPVEAIAKVWLNRQDGMSVRLHADNIPKGCQFLFPREVPSQWAVDLKRL
jgi:hypothetical protein